MTKPTTRIQMNGESLDLHYWIVFIEGRRNSQGNVSYILPGGFVGSRFEYSNRKEAELAEGFFHKRNLFEESQVETSAELKAERACADCNNEASCKQKESQPASSCTMFVPNLSPEGKILSSKIYPEERNTKDGNPKDALGIKKAPMSTLPTGVAYEAALAMLEGARKYGRHNYRVMGVRGSVYYDAAKRHLDAWWEGEDIDPDSGLHHLAKALGCLFVLRDSMLMENWVDDRPPRYPNGLNLNALNQAVEELIKKYPDCVEPFCEIMPGFISAEELSKELGLEEAGLTESDFDKSKEKLVVCNRIDDKYCAWDCNHREPHKRNSGCSAVCGFNKGVCQKCGI